MSETYIDAQATQVHLTDILAALYVHRQPIGRVELFEDAARLLSEIARKDPPWSWRYVQSISSGSVAASVKFGAAVQAFGAVLDGLPAVVAGSVAIQVYAPPQTVKPGSIILMGSKPCHNPGCPIWIVSRSSYCSDACRKKARNKRDRERRRQKG
jgi:hypothetical protein